MIKKIKTQITPHAEYSFKNLMLLGSLGYDDSRKSNETKTESPQKLSVGSRLLDILFRLKAVGQIKTAQQNTWICRGYRIAFCG